MTFTEVEDRTDVYVAREFEGITVKQVFDTNTYLEMRSMQKILLVYMFSRDTRRLAFSRLMSKPRLKFRTGSTFYLAKMKLKTH